MAAIDDAVARYRLSDNAGNGTWLDSSGNGNNLTGIGTPTSAAGHGGIANGAVDLERTFTQYLTAPDSASLSVTTAFTLACWVKLESQTGINVQSLITKWDEVISQASFALTALADGRLVLNVSNNGTTTVTEIGTTNLAIGTWYHIFAIYNGTTLALYVDNVVEGTPLNYSSGVFDSNVAFRIGNRVGTGNIAGNTPDTFDGIIDDVILWNRALDSAERSEVFGLDSDFLPSLYSGAIARYKLSDTPGGTWLDDTAYTNNLSENGTGSPSSEIDHSGTASSAAGFVAANSQYLSAPDNTSLTVTNAITVAAWVKLTSGGVFQVIVSKEEALSNDKSWNLYIDSLNKARFLIHNTSDATIQIIGSTALSIGTWYHVIGTYDGANISLYIGNVSDATPIAQTGNVKDSSTALRIGASSNTTPIRFFNGVIDDVVIWNRVITSGERVSLFASGTDFAASVAPIEGTLLFAAAMGLTGFADAIPVIGNLTLTSSMQQSSVGNIPTLQGNVSLPSTMSLSTTGVIPTLQGLITLATTTGQSYNAIVTAAESIVFLAVTANLSSSSIADISSSVNLPAVLGVSDVGNFPQEGTVTLPAGTTVNIAGDITVLVNEVTLPVSMVLNTAGDVVSLASEISLSATPGFSSSATVSMSEVLALAATLSVDQIGNLDYDDSLSFSMSLVTAQSEIVTKPLIYVKAVRRVLV